MQAPTVYVSMTVENLTDDTIESYRVNFAIVVETEPERPVAAVFSLDCASAALDPGERRSGAFSLDDEQRNATGLADCTIAGWPIDANDPQEVAVHDALAEGSAPDVGVELTTVTFSDGAVIEEAGDA